MQHKKLTFIFLLEESLFTLLVNPRDNQLVVEFDRRTSDCRHSTLISTVQTAGLDTRIVGGDRVSCFDPHAFPGPLDARSRTRNVQFAGCQFGKLLSIRIS